MYRHLDGGLVKEKKNNSVYPSELYQDLRELVIVSLVAEGILPAYHNTTFFISPSVVLIYICIYVCVLFLPTPLMYNLCFRFGNVNFSEALDQHLACKISNPFTVH